MAINDRNTKPQSDRDIEENPAATSKQPEGHTQPLVSEGPFEEDAAQIHDTGRRQLGDDEEPGDR